MEELIIKKPEFKNEITAEITGISKIEDNIAEVKDYAVALNDYYKNIIWTPDTLADAKTEKANINKFKSKVADFRKSIIAKFNEPIKTFEDTAKATEKILAETYASINIQTTKYEEEHKQAIKEVCKQYFNELAAKEEIDFIEYEQMNQNVTLSSETASGSLTAKTKKEIDDFIEKVKNALALINTQEHKVEIMTEYKKDLDVARAITVVDARIKAEAEEAARQAELKAKEDAQPVIAVAEPAQEVIELTSAPIEVELQEDAQKEEEVVKMTFTVTGTITRLKALKAYLVKEGFINE